MPSISQIQESNGVKTQIEIRDNNDVFSELLGQPVLLFTTKYIYYGVLEKVGEAFCYLKNPYIVVEVDAGDPAKIANCEPMKTVNNSTFMVQISHIESAHATLRKPTK